MDVTKSVWFQSDPLQGGQIVWQTFQSVVYFYTKLLHLFDSRKFKAFTIVKICKSMSFNRKAVYKVENFARGKSYIIGSCLI